MKLRIDTMNAVLLIGAFTVAGLGTGLASVHKAVPRHSPAAVPQITLADPLGDWDGDGRSNLMEYALGTDPTNPTDNSIGMKVWIMQDSGNNYLALGFKQRIVPGMPLVYQPEVSGDKQIWSSDSGHVLAVNVTAMNAQFNWVTVRDTTPLTSTTPRFIRLTVIEN